MTEIEIAKWVVLTIMGLAIWFLKRNIEVQDKINSELREEIKVLKNETQNEITSIKDNYLHRNDFRDFKDELKGYLKEIRDDLKELMKVNKNDIR